MPPQPFPPETPVSFADEISEEENLMLPLESGAEPPENPEEEIADVSAASGDEENIFAEETVPAQNDAPAAEEPSGEPDDNDAESAVEAASEAKGKTPPPVDPMPKKFPAFSLFLLVVCAAVLAAGAYILFSNDPRFEQPKKNFFSLIGREPRAEAEETENEASVPAEGESGEENYDEADYFMN